jgi:hypothetical protein
VADKFQSLVREVMNTELADLRKIGEETYFNETTKDYTVYVAYEIKKNAMFRFMKKQARTEAKIERTGTEGARRDPGPGDQEGRGGRVNNQRQLRYRNSRGLRSPCLSVRTQGTADRL